MVEAADAELTERLAQQVADQVHQHLGESTSKSPTGSRSGEALRVHQPLRG
jgi:hypothetical protein